MLMFIEDKTVKVWFRLWKIEKDGKFTQLAGKYPLEYSDSRFHRAYELLRIGGYIALEDGKTPYKGKPIQIDYSAADKAYRDGVPLPTGHIKVDWYTLFLKLDDSRSYNRLKAESRIAAELADNIKYFQAVAYQSTDKALMKAVKLYKEFKPVPPFIEKRVIEYIANERKNERHNSNKASS